MNILKKNSTVSNTFLLATLLSIAGSIVIWVSAGEDVEQAQRLALFVGLWAPTFMGFGNYYKDDRHES